MKSTALSLSLSVSVFGRDSALPALVPDEAGTPRLFQLPRATLSEGQEKRREESDSSLISPVQTPASSLPTRLVMEMLVKYEILCIGGGGLTRTAQCVTPLQMNGLSAAMIDSDGGATEDCNGLRGLHFGDGCV